MFNVHYYKHTANYYQRFAPAEDEIHLTQSESFHEYLKKKSASGTVLAYKTFMRRLFPEWLAAETEILFRSRVREYVNDELSQLHISQRGAVLEEYVKASLFLVNMGGMRLYAMNDLSAEQQRLIPIVEKILKEPVVSGYLHERATLSPVKIKSALDCKRDRLKVFVHHFDYLDTERMGLFHLLERIGMEVTFCIPYDPAYPGLYRNWEHIYEHILGVSKEEWTCVQESELSRKGSRFAHYIAPDVEPTSQDEVDLTFRFYEHPTQFKEEMKANPIVENQLEICSIHNQDLNLYASLSGDGSFYSTRQGKFLLSIQNCRKTSDDIHLTYDDYVNMMVSGWVESGGVNGEQALTFLVDMRPHLDDIHTFQELMERLNSLNSFQEVGEVFDEVGKVHAGKDRVKRYLMNPWRSFPILHRSRYSITIKQLIECSKDLRRKMNRLVIDDHTTVLVREYIHELKTIYASVSGTWEDVLRRPFTKLYTHEINPDLRFGKEEMAAILAVFLGRKSDGKETIKDFEQVVGKAMLSDALHVTGLSFKTFPWSPLKLPGLLNHTWLKKSIRMQFVSHNRQMRINALLIDYHSRNETRNRSLYTLYHILAYAKGPVTFSYIDELMDKDGPSIYLSILQELYGGEGKEEPSGIEEAYEWDEPVVHPPALDEERVEKIPDLYWLDSDFCKKKFFLNSFIEQNPIYEKRLHQQMLFGIIGSLLSEQGNGRTEVKEMIYPLFPQWTKTLKDNLIDTTSVKGLREYKSYENIFYPKAMNRVQKLFSSNPVTENWKAKNQYDKETFKLESHLGEFTDSIRGTSVAAHSGKHCRMCPFLMSCREGEYAIDAHD